MKRVYFVRHGITGGNETDAYQLLDTPLSEKGRGQAEFMAKRFSKIPFDALIASTMERAQETARAIAKETKHEVVSEKLFHEILRSSVVRGKLRNDPEVLEVISIAKSLWTSANKRHSDEENFVDLRNRAVQALDYLTNRPEETFVVVTHGTFLKMMLSVMLGGKNVEPDLFDQVDELFFPQNTGITWVEYDNKHRPGDWQVITWNDHAHLG